MPTKPIQFAVSPAEYEQLCDLAREGGCSVGDLAREAVRVMYLEPRHLQSRLDALNDMLASLEALAEDDEPADHLRQALETPSQLTVPAKLSRLLAGLENGGMFAGLEEIMNDLDELRAQLETDLEQAGEGDVP